MDWKVFHGDKPWARWTGSLVCIKSTVYMICMWCSWLNHICYPAFDVTIDILYLHLLTCYWHFLSEAVRQKLHFDPVCYVLASGAGSTGSNSQAEAHDAFRLGHLLGSQNVGSDCIDQNVEGKAVILVFIIGRMAVRSAYKLYCHVYCTSHSHSTDYEHKDNCFALCS